MNKNTSQRREASTCHDEKDCDEWIVIPWNEKPRNIEKPEDCRWTMKADVDSVVFEKREVFWWSSVLYFTFGMLFWNGFVLYGIVHIFLKTSAEGFVRWFDILPLIPLSLGVIALFVLWFFALFAPFRYTRWSISRHEAVCCVGMFGIGRKWRYSLENCGEMVINGDVGGIIFVDVWDEELFTIGDTVKDEALWMADNVLGYR